ncbi:SDR family oxidoreductase [Paenibacillus sp. TRM 82003]|nr:SDR family oxidoreductase [Paenibacillus sp. TRM 82003]
MKKVVVVTGASRGIGRNMAMYFAQREFLVVGTGRSAEQMRSVAEELAALGPEHRLLPMEATEPADVRRVVDTVFEQHGRIDVWINNAGAFRAIGPTWEVDASEFVNDVSTNVFGTFHCVQAVVPRMLRQGFGRVINLTGGGTGGSFPNGNGYGTSKTAVARFTENLSDELEGTPVLAFAMDPGLNDTDMTRYQRETEVGRTYFSFIERLFQEHHDVGPEVAPRMAYGLAVGDLDAYRGRMVSVYSSIEELQRRAEGGMSADDGKLRFL